MQALKIIDTFEPKEKTEEEIAEKIQKLNKLKSIPNSKASGNTALLHLSMKCKEAKHFIPLSLQKALQEFMLIEEDGSVNHSVKKVTLILVIMDNLTLKVISPHA